MSEQFVEMELREIQISDDPRDHPLIVLAEKGGSREFPIFIGPFEAHALEAAVLNQIPVLPGGLQRPLSHDLMLNLVNGLGGQISRILITKLESSTFFGAIEVINASGDTVLIDSRPSDAMVVAVKSGVPVFVEEQVLASINQDDTGIP